MQVEEEGKSTETIGAPEPEDSTVNDDTTETERPASPKPKSESPALVPSPRKVASPAPVIASPKPSSPAPPTSPITADQIHQLLFDSLYLDEALHRRRKRGQNGIGSVASLAAKVDSVAAKALHVEEELRVRLEGAAREYWKKTVLLFGLLGT